MVQIQQEREPDKRLPAYLQLRDRLAARIAAGEWRADDVLPSENVLTRESGLSVGTVRRAIQQLVDEGLLERRQGSGTFLRKPAFDATLFRFFALQPKDGKPVIPVSRVIARTRAKAPSQAAQILGTEDCIRIDRLRVVSDEILLSEEIWLPNHLFDGFDSVDASSIGPLLYPYYQERYGVFVARAEDEVSFATASPAQAQRLNRLPGDPLARIERTAFSLTGDAIEWRVAYGDAARFRYRSNIT
ncbi:GntR family transcriptional regulator [Thalassospira lucentensis]|uniref:GntR family transcriptional regulator n=1 Tax=Thalassospira lucentensis TaxID=168935 RepID=UPI003AA7EBAB